VTAHGMAAHSALPHLGANAIEAIAPVIAAYVAEHERLQAIPATTELGTSTISVTMIDGGTGANVIPASCSLTVGQRVVPGQRAHDVYERLVEIARSSCAMPVTCESVMPPQPDGTFGSDAFYQPSDTPLVRSLAEWAGNAPAVAPFATNALRYVGFARELAVFGPGSIDEAHQATECVSVADLVSTAEVFTRWLRPS
jgi:acetylornithine deacetylase/succinyl-diaminopimelate desuccinylase-like protein